VKAVPFGIALLLLWHVPVVPIASQSDRSAIREAAVRGFARIQATQNRSRTTQSCTATCHLQLYGALAYRAVRERNVDADEQIARRDAVRAFRNLATNLSDAVEGTALGEIAMNEGFSLVAAHAVGLRPSIVTAALARAIALQQEPGGNWPSLYERPPSNYSGFTFTAIALRALQLYGHPNTKDDTARRVERARVWLRSHAARDTEERAYQLLGLAWAGEDKSTLDQFGQALTARQRPDGGWNSVDGRSSDAYSTGEALVALHDAAGMSIDAPSWRRGLEYLLRTQAPDGSWHVKTRLPPWVSPPYFESGYPYGRDQFISVAGANWATIALARALGGATYPPRLPLDDVQPAPLESWVETAMFGTVAELSRLLDEGLSVNATTGSGRIPLLAIVMPDAAKAKLLLDRGADVNRRSDRKYSALMVGAQYADADEAIRLLLDRGGKVDAGPEDGRAAGDAFAVYFAAHVGNAGLIAVLQRAGGRIEGRALMFGGDPVSPLAVAVMYDHAAAAEALLKLGATVDPRDVRDVAPLVRAVTGNRVEMARLLIRYGADVNRAGANGMTALMYAAAANFGDSAMIDLLLESGARIDLRDQTGRSAADLAREYNEKLVHLLEQRNGK
jgi:ankyrin repeat protein